MAERTQHDGGSLGLHLAWLGYVFAVYLALTLIIWTVYFTAFARGDTADASAHLWRGFWITYLVHQATVFASALALARRFALPLLTAALVVAVPLGLLALPTLGLFGILAGCSVQEWGC